MRSRFFTAVLVLALPGLLSAQAEPTKAEAEAKATMMVSSAIAKGDLNAINYFVAQKYTEALQQIASAKNQKVIMLPLEASSLIGSLAGIGEIARESLRSPREKGMPQDETA